MKKRRRAATLKQNKTKNPKRGEERVCVYVCTNDTKNKNTGVDGGGVEKKRKSMMRNGKDGWARNDGRNEG